MFARAVFNLDDKTDLLHAGKCLFRQYLAVLLKKIILGIDFFVRRYHLIIRLRPPIRSEVPDHAEGRGGRYPRFPEYLISIFAP